MPEILDRCVRNVMEQGHDESSAYAICRTSLGMKSDGSEDGTPVDITEDEMASRVRLALQFQDGPALIKEMKVCGPMGKFVNGEQRGVMDKARLAGIAKRFSEYRRQVPIFMLGDHPETNDERPAVGWVEGLKMVGSDLYARVKLFGAGAAAVGGDMIRGASIFTVQAKDYAGEAIGEVLKHLLLTNEPYYKDLNVAATQDGADAPLCVFTALEKESAMADPKELEQENVRLKDEIAALKTRTADETLAAELKEARTLLVEKTREVAELTASNENLKADVEKFKSPKAIEELTAQLRQEQRKNRAAEVRRKVSEGVAEGQFSVALVGAPKSGYNHPSDEMVLSWFKQSAFKDDIQRLDIMLETMPKQKIGRTFPGGSPVGDEVVAMTAEGQEFIRSHGMDPEKVAAAMKAKTAKDYAAAVAAKE